MKRIGTEVAKGLLREKYGKVSHCSACRRWFDRNLDSFHMDEKAMELRRALRYPHEVCFILH